MDYFKENELFYLLYTPCNLAISIEGGLLNSS